MSYAIDPFSGSVRPASGNATVPVDAPIQPPQAFVDTFTNVLVNGPAGGNFAGLGWTSITDWSYWTNLASIQSNIADVSLDFSGNALDVVSVNNCLSAFAAIIGSVNPGILNISGGTNAASSIDTAGKEEIIFRDGSFFNGHEYIIVPPPFPANQPTLFWFNRDSGDFPPDLGSGYSYFEVDITASNDASSIRAAFTQAVGSASIAWSVTVNEGANATIQAQSAVALNGAGSSSGPGIDTFIWTAPGNAAKAALITAGWTVTTN